MNRNYNDVLIGRCQSKKDLFDKAYNLQQSDVKRIATMEGMYLREMDVILVRSKLLPVLGDHYALVIGHNVEKEHGLRPQMAIFPALANHSILDAFDKPNDHVVILKLTESAKEAFLQYYEINSSLINTLSFTHVEKVNYEPAHV